MASSKPAGDDEKFVKKIRFSLTRLFINVLLFVMNLPNYLIKHGLNVTSFVLKANKEMKNGKLSQPTVWRVVKEKVSPRLETALLIEKATGGEVTWQEVICP